MNSTAKPGQPSPKFKLMLGVGFVVVCLGLFAPKLIPGTSAPTPIETTDTTPAPTDGSSLGGTVFKMLVGVGVVAVVVIGISQYLKKKQPATVSNGLEVLASLPVDARCVVHLVRVADRRMLIGIDASGVKAAVELPQGVPLPGSQVIGPLTVNATSAPLPADVAALLNSLRANPA